MLEAENKSLKARIQELEAELAQYRSQEVGAPTTSAPPPAPQEAPTTLDPEEYKRYGRQMILPEIALQGKQSQSSPATTTSD